MERQRSFSVKPIRFLVFSLTLSSCVIFLVFFSVWVIRFTPYFHQETHLAFNRTSYNFGLQPFLSQTVAELNESVSANKVKSSIFVGAHFGRAGIRSQINEASTFEGFHENESGSKVAADEVNKGDVVSKGLIENLSAIGVNNSIIVATHSTKNHNASSIALGSFSGRLTQAGDDKIHSVNNTSTNRQEDIPSATEHSSSSTASKMKEKNVRVCDITKGKWVFDESYPLYTSVECPFIDEGFNCEANGRLDKDYMKWRWQPQDCDIPRFNATKMLELIRGKRLVFIGDSINRNQWESMLCLLMGAIKDPKKVYEAHGRKITKEKGNYVFKFVVIYENPLQDYKCTVEFHVSHFLVHESKAKIGKKRVQTLRIDTIDRGSSRWRGADILIFNTAHWWNHHKTKAGINYYQEEDQIHPRLDVPTAFQRALTTWAAWVDQYVRSGKTKVFFRSSAPSHFSGGQWNNGGHCKEASQPIHDTSTVGYSEKNLILEKIMGEMKTPVTFLNITGLSDYRIDGHPSVYGRKNSNTTVEDCSHWCLPGVPDIWNQMLYFHLQLKRRDTSSE